MATVSGMFAMKGHRRKFRLDSDAVVGVVNLKMLIDMLGLCAFSRITSMGYCG